MSFFDFWFGKPVYREDAFFGRLQWLGDNKSSLGYFEGERLFKPTGKLLELSIDAPKTGPTAAHIAFFQWVEAQYPALCRSAGTLILAEFGNWMNGVGSWNFEQEFWPVGVDIPANPADPQAKWELSFNTVHDVNHTVTVCFAGATPVHVLVDGC